MEEQSNIFSKDENKIFQLMLNIPMNLESLIKILEIYKKNKLYENYGIILANYYHLFFECNDNTCVVKYDYLDKLIDPDEITIKKMDFLCYLRLQYLSASSYDKKINVQVIFDNKLVDEESNKYELINDHLSHKF